MKEQQNPYENLSPMLSYAQQAEDVIIRRGLQDVKEGFYVDLGAGSPDSDSVTRYFYDRGWNGINVEPQPALFELLERKRPRDINLAIAIGAEATSQTLTVYPGKWGWASTSDGTRAMHQASGVESKDIDVEMLPLGEMLEAHADGKRIDFLKIDIEGGEKEALQTMDFERWQPTIIVVEATKPGTSTQNHDEWEAILSQNGYNCALFDGLNRFYAKDEQIVERISAPANTFDQYIPFRWWRLLPEATRAAYIERGVAPEDAPMGADLTEGKDPIDWV